MEEAGLKKVDFKMCDTLITNTEMQKSNYWYVYAPSLGEYGYVNCSYLR